MNRTFQALIICLVLAFSQFSLAIAQIPSSDRSRKAIMRTRPILISEFQKKQFSLGSPIFIRIFKESLELELWVKNGETYSLFKTYQICTYGSEGLGPKTRYGDGKAPEGFYFVSPQNLNPFSDFHLSFNLGYPNRYDRAYNRTGSALMVHGDCVSIGCYAMTDEWINEIFTLADTTFRNGQKFFRVHIFPFRMTDKKMNHNKDSKWISFWSNLKEGYDYFEKHKIPPNVEVRNKKYVFGPS